MIHPVVNKTYIMEFLKGKTEDMEEINFLLKTNQLPVAGAEDMDFIIARHNKELVIG
jgi:hypothetical protein